MRGQVSSGSSHQVQAEVYFQIGKSSIDLDFQDNRRRLDAFIGSLQKVLTDSNYVVNRVEVMGTASPDGREELNIALAGRRARTLADYILSHTHLPDEKIEVVNGGENWSGLRVMIESSDMPYKQEMLHFMDLYSDNRDQRKSAMLHHADSKPWTYMSERFFPALRMGAGGAQRQSGMSALARENWRRTRDLINQTALPQQTKEQLLSIIDTETDPAERDRQLYAACTPEAYKALQQQLMTGLLTSPSVLSVDNWSLLRSRVASDMSMPGQAEALRIIDEAAANHNREQLLRELNGGESYRYIQDHFFPELLVASAPVSAESYVDDGPTAAREGLPGEQGTRPQETTTLSNENWSRLRTMIESSSMPHKQEVLALIDTVPDVAARIGQLQALDDGTSYIYITEVFFPELLYGLSPSAQENWNQLTAALDESALLNKAPILEIIHTTPPGAERERAIRALDDGESWRQMGSFLLPTLLQNTESVKLAGSGMSFHYELTPAAKAREAEAQRRIRIEQAEQRAREVAAAKEQALREEEARRARERAEREAAQLQARERRKMPALIALKTDLVLWGSVMPGFKMGTFTPNLSAEFYFAHRWSVQLGGAYSNWNALSGDKGLYAVVGVELEPRLWFRTDGLYRGLYTGLFGVYGQFDVQQKTTGTTGTFFMGGLSAGWTQTLSRHLYLDLGLRLGYRSGQGDVYDIEEEHYYFNRKENSGTFAPQVRVQLVYRFGKLGQ